MHSTLSPLYNMSCFQMIPSTLTNHLILPLNVTTICLSICYQPSAIRSSDWAFPGPTLEEFLANTSSSRGTYCLTFLLMFIPKIFQKTNSLMIFYQFWAPKKRRLLKNEESEHVGNINQQCIFFSNNFHASTLMFCVFLHQRA